MKHRTLTILLMAVTASSCSMQGRIDHIRECSTGIEVSASCKTDFTGMEKYDSRHIPDTTVFIDGEKFYAMQAYMDSNGTVVSTSVLKPAVVVADFRNAAEREGKVELLFDIVIPPSLTDSKWQIRMQPELYMGKDTVGIDEVLITGHEYREWQMKGYRRFGNFMDRIITDTSALRYNRLIEIFSSRMAESGSTEIGYSDITGHYSRHQRIRANRKRIARKEDMFRRYVKSPVRTAGIKTDSVVGCNGESIVYTYRHTLEAMPGIKSVSIGINGTIYMYGKEVYSFAGPEPVTFYISSITSLGEDCEKYIKTILYRNVVHRSNAYAEFDGDSITDGQEIRSAMERLVKGASEEGMSIDSLVISAGFPSSYGEMKARILSGITDSLCRSIMASMGAVMDRPVRIYCEQSDTLPPASSDYSLIKMSLYSQRKGIGKDSIHVTTKDTTYSEGIRALKMKEYKKALSILKRYGDINTAVAYLSLDYNASAIAVLEKLPASAKREYMLALAHAREGRNDTAAGYLRKSIEMDPRMLFRCNLDPEMSWLQQKYNINNQ